MAVTTNPDVTGVSIADVQFSRDSAGNVNGIKGDGGGVIAQIPIGVPSGIDWLDDTRSGFDIYSKGFVKTPTMFFDPTATASTNRGGHKKPYYTQAALQAVCAGDMSGQVLGLKRGTTLRVTGAGGLIQTVYGTTAKPFYIVPYGDAEALPIITGGVLVAVTGDEATGWKQLAGETTIWYYTVGATEQEVWQSDVRLRKIAWSTDAPTTLSVEGTATYNSNTLYIRPYGGVLADLGNVEITTSDNVFQPVCSDVLSSGNIIIAGLDVRKGRTNTLSVGCAGLVATAAVDNISIVGCKVGQSGIDNAESLGRDALLVYGPLSDTVRITNLYIAGNEIYDCGNNCIELSSVGGGIIEHNYGHDFGGNFEELWSSNSNVKCRYNRIHHGTSYDSVLGLSFVQAKTGRGMWQTNQYFAAGVRTTDDGTNLINANNEFTFNLLTDVRYGLCLLSGGTGHKVQHNTVITDPALVTPGGTYTASGLTGWTTAGDAASGFADISNNLLYWKAWAPQAQIEVAHMGTLGATASIPTGNNNIYFTASTLATISAPRIQWNGSKIGVRSTYNSALAGYSLDQNCLWSAESGANLTAAQILMNETTFRPDDGMLGATTLTGIGNVYQDGQPYVAATCTIGALLGNV